MTEIHERLATMGVRLPALEPPLAAYLPAVRADSLVFTSGQLPMLDGALYATGLVGERVSAEEAAYCARLCAINALAAVEAEVGLGAVRRVVKLLAFVAAAPGFSGYSGVANGASEFLAEVFGDAGRHARAAVAVSGLALDSPVELEVVVQIDPALVRQ
jgi:enamine deaminase RidA (YjgF/YER057c/UK114 family)